MKRIEKIIEGMFYETEKEDALSYFEKSELNKYMHEKLSEDDFMDFEEQLNALACELAKYWYIKGFNASREMLSEILQFNEEEKARTV